jgi:hypothetical protein
MNMRLRAFGIAAALAVAGGTITLTSGAQHVFACTGTVSAGVVSVYVGASQEGATGATAVGACLDTGTSPFHGGNVEAGVGNGTQAYAVVDGNDANSVLPTGSDKGYIGVSDYETGAKGSGPQDATGCTIVGGGETAGSGTNSGGSYGLKPVAGLTPCVGVTLPSAVSSVVPLVVCGNVSSPDWGNTPRDGCWIP